MIQIKGAGHFASPLNLVSHEYVQDSHDIGGIHRTILVCIGPLPEE